VAVANTNSSVAYNGDGVTTAFPTTFKFLAATDLVVTKVLAGVTTVMVLGADYNVTGAGADEPGGVVNMTVAPAAGGTVLNIARATPIVQPVVLAQSGPLPVKSLNGEFDRLTLIAQEHAKAIAALQAGAAPVTLASAVVTDQFTPGDPVEGSFPRNVACVGTPKEVALITVADLTDSTTIHYGLGLADVGSFIANQFTVKYVPGLVPGHVTKLYFLVLT
jgi:hypothetical protein